jgi:signal transduction histidine kinase
MASMLPEAMTEPRLQTTRDGGRRPQAAHADGTRLRAIVDQVADGIVIVDGDGSIGFVNSAAETLFGRPAKELLGEQFGFPVMAGESTEIEVLRRSEAGVVAELRAVEIDWDEQPALLISLRDITDRRKAEEQARDLAREQAARAEAEAAEERHRRLAHEKAALAEANAILYQKAQEGSRAKSEFLAVVSHELRTPLNAIIGYTDLLEAEVSGPLTEEQHAQLMRIAGSSRHLMEVVDDILTFSRLEAGREDVVPEPVDYAELVRDAVALVEPIADKKGLSVHVAAPSSSCIGETDARKLRQILLNLLSNAAKFTEKGAVWIEAHQEDDEIVIRVRDTGIGIPESYLEHIWEPFSQVEPSHTRTAGGTGLGLGIVHRLTRLMGGSVSVESTPGRGSTFTVRLPLRVQAHP